MKRGEHVSKLLPKILGKQRQAAGLDNCYFNAFWCVKCSMSKKVLNAKTVILNRMI